MNIAAGRRPLFFVLALAVSALLPAAGRGQTSGPARVQPSGPRKANVAVMLKGWDRNRDGLLQQEEIPLNARLDMALAARKKGLDPKKPLPLNKLLAPVSPRGKGAAGLKKPPYSKEKADSAELKKPPLADEKEMPTDQRQPAASSGGNVPSRVPGFGVPNSRPAAAGFGSPGSKKAALNMKSPQDGDDSKPPAPPVEERFRRLAKSLMAQNDKNKNGQLERAEWSRLRGSPQESDRNGDGVLSQDELAAHLAGYGTRRQTPAASRSANYGKLSYRSGAPGGAKPTFRFLSPHERLPEGIPDWFTRKDVDLDGQVSMAEYSPVWHRANLEEFASLDLNGDGLIVPKECLRAATGK